MAEVKFKRKSKLEIDSTPTEDGSVLFSTDTPEIFMDNGDKRIKYGGGEGSTSDYSELTNKPQINGVELVGNKTLDDLSIQPKGNYLTSVPQAKESVIGGIKAKPKTDETVEVVIDESTGKLYVPTYPESSGGSTEYIPPKKVNHGTEDTTFTLPPNEEHTWDEVAELNLTLQEGEEAKSNIYCVSFTSGSTATRLSITPTATLTKDIEPNGKYTIVILNGIAAVGRGDV